MTNRTLSLKREALAELTTGELAHVVGAGADCDATCPYLYCVVLTNALTCQTCAC